VDDYVLGREGIPEKGKLPLEGLINQVPRIEKEVKDLGDRFEKMQFEEEHDRHQP
jgi:hypothetical protein